MRKKRTKERRELSRDTLSENGIEFDEEIEEDIVKYFESSANQQALLVAQGLLDFDAILSPSNLVSRLNFEYFNHPWIPDASHPRINCPQKSRIISTRTSKIACFVGHREGRGSWQKT
jgi:hypothetical protein